MKFEKWKGGLQTLIPKYSVVKALVIATVNILHDKKKIIINKKQTDKKKKEKNLKILFYSQFLHMDVGEIFANFCLF